jgi:carbonic anhydrase
VHDIARHDRAAFLRATGAVAVGLGLGEIDVAEAADTRERPRTPQQALARLMAGNERFVRGKLTATNAIVERRQDVAGGQQPFAILLTCADSRVPPEHIFDATLGEIFVCRIAGNILDPRIVGSIEYAVAHFHSPLLMVLGHQRCGAVKDTIKLVKSGKRAPGSIQDIVESIAPIVRRIRRDSLSEAAYLDRVIRANIRSVTRKLPSRSAIVRKAVAAGKLRIEPAEYSLDSGKVQLLD